MKVNTAITTISQLSAAEIQ